MHELLEFSSLTLLALCGGAISTIYFHLLFGACNVIETFEKLTLIVGDPETNHCRGHCFCICICQSDLCRGDVSHTLLKIRKVLLLTELDVAWLETFFIDLTLIQL